MLRSATTSYYQADGLGSITSLSSGAGALAQTYTFDSFGNQTASSGSLTNPFQYTARESDPETGLYYYRARYYDPQSARFVSEDPVRFRGGFDFYAYVDNAPIGSTDPMGLCGPCDNVPPHPPDANVDTNMLATQQNAPKRWYILVSTPKGPWDYKYYHGQPHPEYDDFGNFNYGATGYALGIPLNILLRAAGLAKSNQLPNDPYGSPFGAYPYGNQPDKQQQIINGYEFCKNCTLLSNKK
jgi:type VI secretion system secreted protein VgrG